MNTLEDKQMAIEISNNPTPPTAVAPDTIHAAEQGSDPESDLVKTVCGLEIQLDPEGNILTDGVDFVEFEWRGNSTCPTCRGTAVVGAAAYSHSEGEQPAGRADHE